MADTPDEGSSASSDDPELAAAIDGFVARARREGQLGLLSDLPAAERLEPTLPGRRIGDFELVRELGAGASGVVWEARQLSLGGRPVALKLLRAALDGRNARLRFEREIGAIRRLDHHAVVPILAAGDAGGVPFYAMKFVAGMAANLLLRRLRERAELPGDAAAVRALLHGPVPPAADGSGSRDESSHAGSGGESIWRSSYVRWVAHLGMELAEGLQHAHEHGLVHRDVKPANVLVDLRGRPVLVDFGLALDADRSALTVGEGFRGSLAYAPPEQVRGERVDTRADVYALGATLYELLTLRRPLDAASEGELRRRILEEDPPGMGAHVPAPLRTIVSHALEKTPSRRYATPGDMAHDLREFLGGRPIRARPRSAWARGLAAVARRPKTATAVAAGVLLLLGLEARDRWQASRAVRGAREVFGRVLALEGEHARLLDAYQGLFVQDAIQRQRPDPRRVEAQREEIERCRDRLAEVRAQCEAEGRRALGLVASHGPARALLGELYSGELRTALREARDVLAPAEIALIEARLRTVIGARPDPLLEDVGDLELVARQPGAWIRLQAGERVLAGAGELRVERLPAGTYFAEVGAPGRLDARLPILVRRRAVYADPRARPPRRLEIELLSADEAASGFAYVPPGWSLVEDEPPRWEHVEGFQMRILETTYADWLAFLDLVDLADPATAARRDASPFAFRPRSADGLVHVDRDPRARTWSISQPDYGRPDLPVRGVAPTEATAYARYETWLRPPPPGWELDLPRVDELIRAARGADGRRFVWGEEWEPARCAAYHPGEALTQPEPSPVGSHPGDVSVFGIHDLAGSVREFSSDPFDVAPDVTALFGGSYRSYRADAFTTTRLGGQRNEPHEEAGFRLVLRPVSSWRRGVPGAPARLEDEFERPDGEKLGGGWFHLTGGRPGLRPAWDTGARAFLAGGRIVSKGGEGNGSLSSLVLHPLDGTAESYLLRARFRAQWDMSDAVDPGTRGVSFLLMGEFEGEGPESLRATLPPSGQPTLAGSSQPPATARIPVAAAGSDRLPELCLELLVRGRTAELRVWPADEAPPSAPQVLLPDPPRRPLFLGLQASNYIGARLEVESLCFEPLD